MMRAPNPSRIVDTPDFRCNVSRVWTRISRFGLGLGLALLACEGSAPDVPGNGEIHRNATLTVSPEIPVGDDLQVLPVQSIVLADGTSVAFYVWSDGSVGVAGRAGMDGGVLYALENAAGDSPFVLFWAVSEPGTVVPEALYAVHDHLSATEDALAWEDVVEANEQGWLRNVVSSPSPSPSPCANSAFKAANCLPNAPYNHDACFLDHHGGLNWQTAAVRRYRAAFCLSGGAISDRLYYSSVNQSDCSSDHVARFIWGLSTGSWSATTYLTWTWWAGSNSSSRVWTHSSWNVSGSDTHDWAVLQLVPGTCLD